PLAWFGLFLAASLLTRAPFLDVPLLDLDEAAHVVGSWELLRGGRLYTDFADNKPPLLYVYYALAQMPFGRGLPAVRLFTALLVLPLTALALSAFFRHDRRGLAAGLLYLIYGAAFLAHDMHAAHAEIVFLLPAAWAVVLVRDDEDGARLRGLFAARLLLWAPPAGEPARGRLADRAGAPGAAPFAGAFRPRAVPDAAGGFRRAAARGLAVLRPRPRGPLRRL